MNGELSEVVWHSIPLIGQPRAILYAPQPLTPDNVRHLRAWLELMEAALITPQEHKAEK